MYPSDDDDSDAEAGEISTPPPVLSSYAMLANQPPPPPVARRLDQQRQVQQQQQQQQQHGQPASFRNNNNINNNSALPTSNASTAGRRGFSWNANARPIPDHRNNNHHQQQQPYQNSATAAELSSSSSFGYNNNPRGGGPGRMGRGGGARGFSGRNNGPRDHTVGGRQQQRPFTPAAADDSDNRSRRSSSMASEEEARGGSGPKSNSNYNNQYDNSQYGRGRGGQQNVGRGGGRFGDGAISRGGGGRNGPSFERGGGGGGPARGGRGDWTHDTYSGGGRTGGGGRIQGLGREELGGRHFDRGGGGRASNPRDHGRGGGRFQQGRGGGGRGFQGDERQSGLPRDNGRGDNDFGFMAQQQTNEESKRYRASDEVASEEPRMTGLQQMKRTRVGEVQSFGSEGEITDVAIDARQDAAVPHLSRSALASDHRHHVEGQQHQQRLENRSAAVDGPSDNALHGAKVHDQPPLPFVERSDNDGFRGTIIQPPRAIDSRPQSRDSTFQEMRPINPPFGSGAPSEQRRDFHQERGQQPLHREAGWSSQQQLMARDSNQHPYQGGRNAAAAGRGREHEQPPLHHLQNDMKNPIVSATALMDTHPPESHPLQDQSERRQADFALQEHRVSEKSREDTILVGDHRRPHLQNGPPRLQQMPMDSGMPPRRSSWAGSDEPFQDQQQRHGQDHYGPAAAQDRGGFARQMSQYGPADPSMEVFGGRGRGRGDFGGRGRGRAMRGRGRGDFAGRFESGGRGSNDNDGHAHEGIERFHTSDDTYGGGGSFLDNSERSSHFEASGRGSRFQHGGGDGRGSGGGRGSGFDRSFQRNPFDDRGRGRGDAGRFGRGGPDMRRNSLGGRSDNGMPSGRGHAYGPPPPLTVNVQQQQEGRPMPRFSPRAPVEFYSSFNGMNRFPDSLSSIQRDNLPTNEAAPLKDAMDGVTVIDVDEVMPEDERPEVKACTPPPEPSEPSASVLALTRLLDLETQMEFAFAKHMLLVKKQKLLRAQYDVLKDLPVGIDAIKEDLAQHKAKHEEAASLYEDAAS